MSKREAKQWGFLGNDNYECSVFGLDDPNKKLPPNPQLRVVGNSIVIVIHEEQDGKLTWSLHPKSTLHLEESDNNPPADMEGLANKKRPAKKRPAK